MTEIETNKGVEIEEILRHMYVDLHMPVHDMAKELNISYSICIKWLQRAGIYGRKINLG